MGCVPVYLSTVTPTPHPSSDLYLAHSNTHAQVRAAGSIVGVVARSNDSFYDGSVAMVQATRAVWIQK
jgi:hypothetical protein